MKSAESSDHLSPAADAFAEFVARHGDGEEVDFEAFCGERPEFELKLRRMHVRWRALTGALGELGVKEQPFAEKLAEAYGSDVDPGITLDSDSVPGAGGSASGLIEGLREGGAGAERYTVRSEIARGGMGAVLKVFDRDLRRTLAMKVLLGREGQQRLDPRALSRFLEEAQITGQLDHPGILPVHELGLDAEGHVYFTMPLVRGKDFQAIIDLVRAGAEGWTRTRALGVIVRVCEAMGYAHSKGVLHRDLKPANVMVGTFGEAYVMDWGLARVLGEERRRSPQVSTDLRTLRSEEVDLRPDSPLATMQGDVIGTPVYMSPEQAHGWTLELGPETDVYSIGAMLYHALTGRRPYLAPGDVSSATAVLMAVKTRPPRAVHQLDPTVPAELEAICDKAMARNPKERYGSTMELADDLRAFLETRVVSAYRTGALAEARKWIQRNRRLAAAVASAAVLLVVGLAVSTALYLRSHANEIRADESALRLAAELRTSHIQQGRLAGRMGDMPSAEDLLWREHLHDPSDPASRWALWELYRRYPCLGSVRALGPIHEFPGHDFSTWRGIQDVVYAPDGSFLVCNGNASEFEQGRIRLRDATTLEEIGSLIGHEKQVYSFDIHPDGKLLASASEDGTIGLWDLMTRKRVGTLRADGVPFQCVAFDADGTRLASSEASGVIRVWNPSTGECLAVLEGHTGPVWRLDFHPDGKLLASASADATIRLWRNLESPAAAVLKGHYRHVWTLAFSPDGETLASGGYDRTIRLWDVESGEPISTIETGGTVYCLAYEDEGNTLISGGWYSIDRWDLETERVTRLFATPQSVHGLALSPDRRSLATIIRDDHLRLWDLPADEGVIRFGGHSGRLVAALSDDGQTVATGDRRGRVQVWEATTGRLVDTWERFPAAIKSLDFDPRGRFLAVGSGGVLRIHDASTRALVFAFEGLDGATDADVVDFAPDGRTVVLATSPEPFEIRDVESGYRVARIGREDEHAITVRYDRGGRFFVTITRNERLEHFVSTWTPAGEPMARIKRPLAWKSAVSADGKWVAIGQYGREVEILNADDLSLVRTLAGHDAQTWSVDWHPTDPRLLASCAGDGTVRLWDAQSGTTLLEIDAFGGSDAWWIRFAPDGRSLVVAGSDGNVGVWDLAHYDRHIAGNMGYQLERLSPDLGDAVDVEELSAWAAEVLRRPWPRWSKAGEGR